MYVTGVYPVGMKIVVGWGTPDRGFLVGLLVGVIIALFQALTQIQEQTLIYAPKIIAIFVSLMLFLPLMGALLGGFMRTIAARMALSSSSISQRETRGRS